MSTGKAPPEPVLVLCVNVGSLLISTASSIPGLLEVVIGPLLYKDLFRRFLLYLNLSTLEF